jgi:hypothetical protein
MKDGSEDACVAIEENIEKRSGQKVKSFIFFMNAAYDGIGSFIHIFYYRHFGSLERFILIA